MASAESKSVFYIVKVRRSHISHISSYLEGLDDIGYSTTLDRDKNIVEISGPLSQKENLDKFIEDLQNTIKLKLIRTFIQ